MTCRWLGQDARNSRSSARSLPRLWTTLAAGRNRDVRSEVTPRCHSARIAFTIREWHFNNLQSVRRGVNTSPATHRVDLDGHAACAGTGVWRFGGGSLLALCMDGCGKRPPQIPQYRSVIIAMVG
jgi:hypothetical protein